VEPLSLSLPTVPPTLPGFGPELHRAFVAALKENGVAVQTVGNDSDAALTARFADLPAQRYRLTLSYRGKTAQAVGDLEHVDDLVYAVVAELRPKLLTDTARPAPEAQPSVLKGSGSGGHSGKNETTGKLVSPGRPADKPKPDGTETSKPSPQTKAGGQAAKPTETAAKPTETAAKPTETRPPFASPPPPIPEEGPKPVPPPTIPVERKPRVAVGVMGEPLSSLPPGFYGLGPSGQQALLMYVQQRLRLPASAVRLYGLVGGFEALEQSLRVSARHTLMARLDSISVVGGHIQGRVHVVLLHDGKLLVDRSVALPPTPVGPTEPSMGAFQRAVFAALDVLSPELQRRLSL
jgi:hypothetical protein